MLVKILMDNLAADGFSCEWGLAVYIEYNGHRILLDAGTTGAFVENAAKLGVDLAEVELAVLSHAHYDHANGMDRFFALNRKAKLCISENARENCFSWKNALPKYNGIRRGMLREHAGRILRCGRKEILPGVHLLPHSTPYFAGMGRANQLYARRGFWLRPDDFRHEQSLVFELEDGLAVFNSCSHSGPDVIIREVESAFPGRHVRAILGGFHLYKTSEADVRALSDRIRSLGVEQIVTGHCTGDAAYAILKEELGDRVRQMYAGMCIEI